LACVGSTATSLRNCCRRTNRSSPNILSAWSIVAGQADAEHIEISRDVRRVTQSGGGQVTELIVRAAALRRFLG
jgi:hypothetical protein